MKSHSFIIIAAMLLNSLTSFAQTNLYPDSISGFEIDFWLGSSTQPANSYSVAVASNTVYDGERSILFDCPDTSVPTGGHATVVLGGSNPDYQSGNIAVMQGDYVFSTKVFIEGTAPANIIFYFTEKSEVITAGQILTIPLAEIETGSWQIISMPISFSSDIPEMKTGIRMRGIDYVGLSGASTVYVDQMSLYQEEVIPEDTVYSPISDASNTWEINGAYSDEFNSSEIDLEKWNIDVDDWGTWSWEPDNATSPDTVLALKMQQKQHTRGGTDYYFTSGIAQIKETITYGYFEARIKASAKGQGTCPAFWLYSMGQPTPTEEGGVQYSEIDAVEIFQIPNQLKTLEMNLHTRIIENGELTWKRPGQGDTELTHNSWDASWDPRDEFHTYAVWNRLDSIFWYVDGIQRGAKKNYYWHLPMHLSVSMGLRTPYEKYIDGVRTAIPYPDSIPEEGFPTEMYCDYVRVWNTSPQLYAERGNYEHKEYSNQHNIELECRYFAGNGEGVLADEEFAGVTGMVEELNAEGAVVNKVWASDSTTIGKESGIASISIDISSLNPSASLQEGHYYVLKSVFKTSFQNGAMVSIPGDSIPIKISGNVVGIPETRYLSKIKIYPNPANKLVTVQWPDNGSLVRDISLYNMQGRLMLKESIVKSSKTEVDVSALKAGAYWIKAGEYSGKLLIY